MASIALSLPEALNRAIASYNRGKFSEAEVLCREIITTKEDSFEALHFLAIVQARLGRANDALVSYDRALAVRPNDADALNNRGIVLQQLNRLDEALASYAEALTLKPDDANTLYNRGNALGKLRRFEEALASYERALAVQPDHVAALLNRAAIFQELKRFQHALASYERALMLRPNDVAVLKNRGVILHELKRYDEALASYDQALALQIDNAEILNNRGLVLHALTRFEDALVSFERALALRPDYVEALNNRGNVLRGLKRFDEAMASYERAMTLEPNHRYALNGLAACSRRTCDWTRHDMLVRDVCRNVREQKSIVLPFILLGYSEDEALQLSCAKNYIRNRIGIPPKPLWRGAIWRNDKIKVAYVRGHPMAYLMAELFELHDRSKFEVIGISFGPDNRSELRARLVAAFDQFHDVSAKSDHDVARLLNDLQVDIAVDLQGHQKDARPGIFAFRPAPIQVNYLGFPGTTGADFIDYIIADPIILPLDRQPYYTEKIVHLPDCYQVNDRKRPDSTRVPNRAEVGLPAHGFVFCCFNNNWKITPAVFDVWMRLLRDIEDSVLWLLGDNEDAERNLHKEAAIRGINPTRLIFAKRVNSAHHLARHRLADLFLDTLPYNAHATASYALWAGVPVLTCQGQAFAGRVGASLLSAIGLFELVTYTLADYEAMALRLAQEPNLLRAYRDRLVENRLSCPLFDTDRFRGHIEAAYCRMWQLWQQDEKPRSFAIAT
jgi:protein O-GlcNAc transferase